MGKVKIKKQSTWIDMTPMSDVMVLLLTFFMLTSTFVKNEPVKVLTPNSVSEIKVPEKDVLNILVDKEGKVFKFGVSLTNKQVEKFQKDPMWGVSMEKLSAYLNLPEAKMATELGQQGIPTDSIDGKESEFQLWVKAAKGVNKDLKLAIKADEGTPYRIIKKVLSELQDMQENRYYLITSLKTQED